MPSGCVFPLSTVELSPSRWVAAVVLVALVVSVAVVELLFLKDIVVG